jgi:hypothetical protein
MALSKDRNYETSGLTEVLHGKLTASVTYYKGGIVVFDPTSGLVVKAADTAGFTPVGVLKKGAVVGAGVNPDCEIETGKVWLPMSGAAQGDVGDYVYATADDTIAKTGTNANPCGKVVDFKTGYLLIDFRYGLPKTALA